MRIGVDVGGTNTDAVLISGSTVISSTKQPTTSDVSSGIAKAITTLLEDAVLHPTAITAVMIGTTHFTNALVECSKLDEVGVIRLASPSGEALPPLSGWPEALVNQIGKNYFLLPGGYEYDGRDISSFDEAAVRNAAQTCKARGINSIAISCAFAPINPDMEKKAAKVVQEEHPHAVTSLSHEIGRLGLIERENGVILNAALSTLAQHVIASFKHALNKLGLYAPLYISQNDGTLISAAHATRYPVMTIGSGPTNSMRGAAFLTGVKDGIVMDVGGTTCDIGVLSKGIPRESSISVDIGSIRTNFRMPDILSIGLGGGTHVHLDPQAYTSTERAEHDLRIGPDSLGYRIMQDSYLFGGEHLTTSDIAVIAGHAKFGDRTLVPAISPEVRELIWKRIQMMIEDGLDRMKTTPENVTIIAVGGGHFLIGDHLKGAKKIVRPPHASVANAIGAAIAQVGATVDQIIDYETSPREVALAQLRGIAAERVAAAGGAPETIKVVDVEEMFLSYLPGRSAQVRMKAVGDLALTKTNHNPIASDLEHKVRHAH